MKTKKTTTMFLTEDEKQFLTNIATEFHDNIYDIGALVVVVKLGKDRFIPTQRDDLVIIAEEKEVENQTKENNDEEITINKELLKYNLSFLTEDLSCSNCLARDLCDDMDTCEDVLIEFLTKKTI